MSEEQSLCYVVRIFVTGGIDAVFSTREAANVYITAQTHLVPGALHIHVAHLDPDPYPSPHHPGVIHPPIKDGNNPDHQSESLATSSVIGGSNTSDIVSTAVR